MGYDAVSGIGTYGRGCMPGAQRMSLYLRARFGAGDLGCFNPASRAGDGPSLHAEGRAFDPALSYLDPAQRARGDAMTDLVTRQPDQFGTQEVLWGHRGVWTWRRRAEGWRRTDPALERAHLTHPHIGIDVRAARGWTPAWLGHAPTPTPTPSRPRPPHQEDDDMRTDEFAGALLLSLKGNDQVRTELMDIQADGLLYILRGGNPELLDALKTVIREATR